MHQQKSLENILKQVVRDASISRIQSLSHLPNVELKETQDHGPVQAHRMAVIMIYGRNLRMTFKAQFSSSSARVFAHQSYGVAIEQVSISQSEDFVREMCNLVAGHVKAFLAQNSVPTGLSLPTLARGFDNFFFRKPVTEPIFEDHWKLCSDQAEVFCSALFEVFHEFEVTAEGPENKDNGDVDFF